MLVTRRKFFGLLAAPVVPLLLPAPLVAAPAVITPREFVGWVTVRGKDAYGNDYTEKFRVLTGAYQKMRRPFLSPVRPFTKVSQIRITANEGHCANEISAQYDTHGFIIEHLPERANPPGHRLLWKERRFVGDHYRISYEEEGDSGLYSALYGHPENIPFPSRRIGA